jgi:hexosaminidase
MMFRIAVCVVALGATVASLCPAAQVTQVNVIPQPDSVRVVGDGFVIHTDTVIAVSDGAEGVGDYLASALSPATGYDLPVRAESDHVDTSGMIRLSLARTSDVLGDEGYTLSASASGIDISAGTPTGLFYGCQTLRQLLPAEIDSNVEVEGVTWAVPGVAIQDAPRFGWRGMHLDTGRHFFDKEFVKHYIDLMARYKLNTFHWHLTEDQGWRIEVKKYPLLTEVGAWRTDEDGERYGGFYTQDDIREVVAYARSRFITVVPEIEMPGHSVAALAAYPELSCTGGPFEVGTKWGVFKDVYCAGNEKTFEMLTDALAEVMELFPGEYIHIGGDECPKDRWKVCEKCQSRIKAEGLKDEHALQSYFIKRIDTFLTEHGRKLIGWDEILEGGLAPGASVMSWRGEKGGIEAAKLGRDVVMSPNQYLYFDFKQSDAPSELGALYKHKPIPLKRVYMYEPVPAKLTEDEAGHIMGAQANVWTEPIQTPAQVEYMILPRMLGLAEVVWSQKDRRDWPAFEARVIEHYPRFEAMNLNYRDHRK